MNPILEAVGVQEGVLPEVAEWLLARQRRCQETGSTQNLEIHHRFPRGDFGFATFEAFLHEQRNRYRECYNAELPWWGLHSVQNLVVLSRNVHQQITDGDRKLFEKYLYSFTCPHTGFNVPFQRFCRSYAPCLQISPLCWQ